MLDELFKELKPAMFNYSGENGLDSEKINFGVMAQDIERGIINSGYSPEHFSILNKDEAGYFMVDYIQLIPLLISKIKQLEQRLEEIEK